LIKNKGFVKWFDRKKGFGFITTDDGQDVFCHYNNIIGFGYQGLYENQQVEFDIVEGPKGLFAKNVSVIS
jgi:CspA family cold shock protein